MTEVITLIKSDLYRYCKTVSLKEFLKVYFLRGSFRYIFWVRVNSFTYRNRILKIVAFPLTWLMWRRYSYKYGISIPYKTQIGYGFKINHFGGVIVNSNTIIGNNVTISHGVTVGNNEISNDVSCPIICDNVYISPGSKIIGSVTVGENVIIGVNSVVTKDISHNKIVGGIPAKIIKENEKLNVKNQYKIN